MADNEVRIGLVGPGVIGSFHLDIWKDTPGAKVVAVCDVNPEKAKAGAEKVGGADVYTDMADMLEKADIDAVDICTPSGYHAEQGLMAIQAGKHALVEKPLDIDLAKVDRLLDAVDKSDRILACIFNNRVGQEIMRANQLINEGALGDLISGSTYIKWWRGQNYYDADAWRGTWALDGGVFSNQGIHAIDQLCWMCGPVKEVHYCHIATVMHQMEAEDFGVAALEFESGARGVIEATTCCYPGTNIKTEVFGTKGMAVFENSNVLQFKVRDEEIDLTTKTGETGSGASDPLSIGKGGHAAQLADFVNCIIEGRKPFVDGSSARVAVEALDKLYKKAGAPKLGT